jgi:hypothetical protein
MIDSRGDRLNLDRDRRLNRPAEVEANMPAGPAAAAGAVPAASPRGDACAPFPRGDAVVSFVPLPASRTSNSHQTRARLRASAAKAKAAPAPAVNLFKRSFMFGTSAQGGEEISHQYVLAALDEAFRFFDLVCATLLPASHVHCEHACDGLGRGEVYHG